MIHSLPSSSTSPASFPWLSALQPPCLLCSFEKMPHMLLLHNLGNCYFLFLGLCHPGVCMTHGCSVALPQKTSLATLSKTAVHIPSTGTMLSILEDDNTYLLSELISFRFKYSKIGNISKSNTEKWSPNISIFWSLNLCCVLFSLTITEL